MIFNKVLKKDVYPLVRDLNSKKGPIRRYMKLIMGVNFSVRLAQSGEKEGEHPKLLSIRFGGIDHFKLYF